MMSYFSRNEDIPHRLIYDMISDSGVCVDKFELDNSEIILAIVDQISQTAKQYFPVFSRPSSSEFLRGAIIADRLRITDAFMHGADCIVIIMPLCHYQNLQNDAENNSRSSANRA